MRKLFGYRAYQGGADLLVIQDLFRHASPTTTLRDIGINQDQRDAVFLSLDL